MEDVKSRGPFIYSVLESAQAFLAQHPFQESEETLADGKGLLPSALAAKCCTSQNVKLAHLPCPSPRDGNPKFKWWEAAQVKLFSRWLLAAAPPSF